MNNYPFLIVAATKINQIIEVQKDDWRVPPHNLPNRETTIEKRIARLERRIYQMQEQS